MKLSILDQAPISSGKSAQEALQNAVKLAQLGEKLGYERFWIAEHHDLYGLANPNPDVMLGVIGAQTEKIKIGAGAVLLPYYKPFRVAETYNLLSTLFPNRIDLGLGRAPGGSAEVSLALSDNYLKQVNEYPKDVEELLNFLHGRFPKEHPYGKIAPTPVPETPPQTWMLGTSDKSAKLAAEKGLNYVFGHFMTDFNGPEIVEAYRENFAESDVAPYAMVAVHVICAETDEQAEEIALSTMLWNINQDKQTAEGKTIPSLADVKRYTFSEKEQEKLAKMRKNMIIGSPETVKHKLEKLQELYQADEWMVVTITYEVEDKFRSYQLLKDIWG